MLVPVPPPPENDGRRAARARSVLLTNALGGIAIVMAAMMISRSIEMVVAHVHRSGAPTSVHASGRPGGRSAGGPQTRTEVAGISIERAAAPVGDRSAAVSASGADTGAFPGGAAALAAMRTRVLGAISFPWGRRLDGWQIEFLGPRTGYRGATFPKRRTIEIYVSPELTADELVHTTAHELGHAVDVTLFDDDARSTWSAARGRSGVADWWVADGRDDFSSGSGDWAECFAWSQLPRGMWYSRLGLPPTAAQLRLMASLVG